MGVAPLLTEEDLDALRQFDTCMISNAIETFDARLRNTGFADAKFAACSKTLLPWWVMQPRHALEWGTAYGGRQLP